MDINIDEFLAPIYSALFVDLPAIEYKGFDFKTRQHTDEIKTRRPRVDEIEVVSFPQTWGSTALGFGGMGGSAMTTAQTVVVSTRNRRTYLVYFGGRLCYSIENPTQKFRDDLRDRNLAPVYKIEEYTK